jgi:putative endonuclease
MNRKKIGATGEKLASNFLKNKGYRILENNFRCRHGEIDIIAQKRGCLIFIEVRTKSSSAFGNPEESITAAKKEKLISTALTYLKTHANSPVQWRIDFIAIELNQEGKVNRIELIENAIEIQ